MIFLEWRDDAVLNSDQILANRYRLILLVGQGTMGAVYDAEDLVFNRRVALKRMRFAPEASPKASSSRPARSSSAKPKSWRRCATPICRASPITSRLATRNFWSWTTSRVYRSKRSWRCTPADWMKSAVLGWADQLLSALEYIHRHGLVHRDVKPANIRVTPEGHVFLVDFGLVKTFDPASPKTATAVRGLGTPQYAPPEQYDAELGHTEPRSDLYALGATLYHLLTGEPPATVTRRVSNPGAFRSLREIKPTVSPEVERVILRAMEVPIAKRFASASDMRSALRLARTQAQADPTGTSHLPAAELIQVRRRNRRRACWESRRACWLCLVICATAFVVAAPGLVPTPTLTPTNTATSVVPAVLPAIP